jgi:hypothetical protein
MDPIGSTGTAPVVNTSRPRYARCAVCEELKHLGPDGLVLAHNRYRTVGTSVEAAHRAGSGRRPRDTVPGEVTP